MLNRMCEGLASLAGHAQALRSAETMASPLQQRLGRRRSSRDGRLCVPNESNGFQFVAAFCGYFPAFERGSLSIHPLPEAWVFPPVLRDSAMTMRFLKNHELFKHVIPRKGIDEAPDETERVQSFSSFCHDRTVQFFRRTLIVHPTCQLFVSSGSLRNIRVTIFIFEGNQLREHCIPRGVSGVPIESEICELLFLCGIDYRSVAGHSLFSDPISEYTVFLPTLRDEAIPVFLLVLFQRIEVSDPGILGAGAFSFGN